MSAISIPKTSSIALAGLLYKASPVTATKPPALIVVHPAGSVKEQAAGLYAQHLSQQGFTTICYDASYQGESGGKPRYLEDPSARVSDISSVVDYIQQNLGSDVDTDKIGVVGVCAGGGYAVAAAKADYRIRAVAAVSLMNIGDAGRLGWAGDEDPTKHVETIKMISQLLKVEAENGGVEAAAATAPYIQPVDDKTPYDLKEAHEYYLTPRAQHPRAENKMLLRSLPLALNFDAFHLADLYLKQPVLTIVGENATSRWHSDKLDKLIGGAATKIVVPKGTHIDLYDKEEFVGPAAKDIADFMRTNLQ
ncbi:hypothetical protein UA08_01228 [Talaromyces atroroseus]|uniref:AB hydrolase-1 domain-containing protein n=1 Tax=Talaromyces atroroseus TaxID=1441469 RepID=A0A1Q5QC43_TALAT|nr:hypothetical protein UA08_01228 [Talaromyces atroroseus]OKL63503.1 hypothetical protein UA08_01228 [Talaromyces atroroseus]